tara:strand:+ start:807 stop:1085 length:279 start_codon:yes stop_codon:yes gene_type:complete
METKLDKLRTYQENSHENAKEKADRRGKKSSKPRGPEVTGMEGFRTQGKGSRNRDLSGWLSDETTKKMEKIFGKKKKNKKTNTGKKVRRYYK